MKLLNAWTHTDGQYPAYLNVTQIGSMCRVIIRAPRNDDGSCGDSLQFVVNVWTLNKIADELKAASRLFETGLDGDVGGGLSV